MENKREFVADVVAALVKHGDGRYDHYANMNYVSDGGMEYIECNGVRYNVTWDSLPALNR